MSSAFRYNAHQLTACLPATQAALNECSGVYVRWMSLSYRPEWHTGEHICEKLKEAATSEVVSIEEGTHARNKGGSSANLALEEALKFHTCKGSACKTMQCRLYS